MSKKITKPAKKEMKITGAKKEKKVVDKKETVKATEAKKVEPTKTTTKKVATAKVEPKKIATAKAPEKIAAKAEPKKITAAKAPEKIATTKAPEKISAKPEPKKIEAKKVESIKTEVKTPTVSTKVEAKKSTAKKVEDKKVTSTKATKQTVKKPAVKKAEKVVSKPVTQTAANKAKLEAYQSFSLEECIAKMQAMNIHYVYEDYYALLLDEADLRVLEKNIIDGNNVKAMNLNFDEVGYDEDLIMVTLTKVADTMDIKALDYADLKASIKKALKFKFNKDGEVNAAQYLDEFKLSEKVLMIAQRKNIADTKDVNVLLDVDVAKFYQHFFDFAYELLPEWQYNDVKFYEDFAYAVLSQFADIYESDQLRVQMDVADLYIKHGDYQHGDEMYGYILRDNQIKDYIYYRYASVYKEIDYNKAKSIAYSSLQYVDDRYTYYTNIMELINS